MHRIQITTIAFILDADAFIIQGTVGPDGDQHEVIDLNALPDLHAEALQLIPTEALVPPADAKSGEVWDFAVVAQRRRAGQRPGILCPGFGQITGGQVPLTIEA